MEPSPTSLQLLTVPEVGERLKISTSAVYRLVESGRLSCHRIGNGRGVIRVSECDLREYLESCRQSRSTREPQAMVTRKPLRHLSA
ncbi:Helix-turn-helix domain protein [Posidoniimonas corsicana]|uniref:Helix-turn-helix domain protein n=1 Tax=Posidoniimonas corsicana TaxID=1938618 RepID=A0A5C5VHH1_9BACT|nr:helix-turn-helix domain-containing protein [Posidoniimonas corsicana]TWT37443.1 Helix-turn-helix domain protein [Posidoniimonas corsicana]